MPVDEILNHFRNLKYADTDKHIFTENQCCIIVEELKILIDNLADKR